ncbi:MAG: hypothetical protein ACE5KM_04880 [Planctomycetaceae bacterium]
MDQSEAGFQVVPIQPVECLKSAKNMIADEYWLFVGICAVGVLLASFAPMALLMGPMYCGIYLCQFTHLRGEDISLNLLFKGFDYFVESLIATLILVAAMTVLIIPMYIVMMIAFVGFGVIGGAGRRGGANDPMAAFGVMGTMAVVYLLIIIVAMLVGTFFAFVYPLIVDRNLKAIPALKTSAKAVWANFGGMLGLTVLSGLLVGVASLCCYLPAFLVFPITFGANLLAYRKVFPETPAGEARAEASPMGDGDFSE